MSGAPKGGRPGFFFFSSAFLSSLSWRSSRGILVVFEAQGPTKTPPKFNEKTSKREEKFGVRGKKEFGLPGREEEEGGPGGGRKGQKC